MKQDPVQYNLVNKQIRRRCAMAKEEWLEMKCQEVDRQVSNSKEMLQKNKKCNRKEIYTDLKLHHDQSYRWHGGSKLPMARSCKTPRTWHRGGKNTAGNFSMMNGNRRSYLPRQLKLDQRFQKMGFVRP